MHWLLIAAGLAAVAAFLGYRLKRRREEAKAYLKGVRSMISDDPDAAIEALSDAARLGSPEAIETYLALGQLFKREGDVPRAIRLHRNMLHKPGLAPGRRAEVERELADDYRRAGMLADAADAYRPLAAAGDAVAAAGLRDVLVDQGRLEEALTVHRERCPADPRLLAHLLALRSGAAREAGEDGFLEHAEAAVAADPSCAHAQVALALARSAAGDRDGARSAVAEALAAAPRSALLAWGALRALDPADADEALGRALEARPDDPRLLFLRGRLRARDGGQPEALAILRRALEVDRDGEVTLALREILRQAAPPGPGELAGRHDLMSAAIQRNAALLRCARCGGGAVERAWRCPRCGAFDAGA